jgi:uncharacterized oxidoreductase
VLDIAQFAGTEHFLHEVQSLCEGVRSCPLVPGVSEITLPGDPERRERARRQGSGIPLDDGTWGQLLALAQGLRVAPPAV